jgi:glycosyltransferase involved in cell wall biosynthesis
MPSAANENNRPFRLGVWCDYYGITLTPTGGIGVFVYNLVAGLLALEDRIEVVLLVRPGDQKVAAAFLGERRGVSPTCVRGKLRVIPVEPKWLSGAALRAWWVAGADFCLRFGQAFQQWIANLELSIHQTTGNLLQDICANLQRKRNWRPFLRAIGFAVSFVFIWGLEACCQLTKETGRIILFPLRLIDRIIGQRISRPKTALEVAGEAGCDVWVVPYLDYDYSLSFPSVLLIHDLIPSRFPQFFPREVVERFNRLAVARSAEATLCACMSGFIRDADLHGMLGLSPSRVRMVRAAPPSDFPEITQERAAFLKPAFLTRPFLLMPAGIRPHKNQANLIRALALLRDRYGEDGLDLVLTGQSQDGLTADLKHLIKEYKLEQRVHFFGVVPREQLACLYQCAFATIIPTLYEECSFPVSEALHWGCPIACSRIPAHLELCAPMGDAMLYFDPLDPDAIARAILQIRDDRQGIRARQYAASRILWRRTWKDAAREWLAVFKEAAEIGRSSASTADKGKSAA